MSQIKTVLFVAVFAVLSMGVFVQADCTAKATSCNVGCSVTAPAGGSTQCTGTATTATCIAYDAAGNQCKFTRCFCPTGGPGPQITCISIIPLC